jgi:hydroxyacid-oxoacid transhydrogenase
MGADISKVQDIKSEAGGLLANCIVDIMKKLDIPNGLSAIGYQEADIPALVEGTLPQHRVTKLSPRPVAAPDLEEMFLDAMVAW